jgi:hypothetical protein
LAGRRFGDGWKLRRRGISDLEELLPDHPHIVEQSPALLPDRLGMTVERPDPCFSLGQ